MPSTSHLSLKDRRRRLEYAARVSALAMDAPDVETKKIVYTACRIIEKRFGFSRDEKKILLLKLIEVGAASTEELVNESRFPSQDVYELVRELVDENKIREERLGVTYRNGRPAVRYFPSE
jgi:hypothetical protein